MVSAPTKGQRKVLHAILRHLRSEGLPAGTHLPEEWLASLAGTSRSPVRAVLQLLHERGLTQYDRNRGYFLAIDAAQMPASLVEAVSTERMDEEDGVYLRIARWRFEGQLSESTTEADLSRLLGVARADVNRALLRAQAEGWAHRTAGYGWEFMPTVQTVGAYDDLYAVRLALEPACLLSTKFRPVMSELQALRREQQAIASGKAADFSPIELFESNSRLHSTIAQWSRNTLAIDILRRLDQLRRLTEYRQAERPLPRRELALEHCKILDAIETGDTLLAASLMREHLDGARRQKAVAAVFPAQDRPDDAPTGSASIARADERSH